MEETLNKVKQYLRISHSATDDDIRANIAACLADLRMLGIANTDPTDPLIYNAVKLYCKIYDTDDPAKAAILQERYDSLKASLQMSAAYREKEGANV